MELTIKATKKYSDTWVYFTLHTYEERVYLKYKTDVEETEENDYNAHREIGIDKNGFTKLVGLIVKVPTITGKLSIEKDDWNTHANGEIEIKAEYDQEDTINLSIESDEYLFDANELFAIMDVLD